MNDDYSYHPDIDAPRPPGAGTTWGVKLLVLAGLLVSIMQGSFVVGSSAFGRVWPAADSAKIELPPANLTTTP